ncbi:MAG: hypothetical protein ACI4QR_04600, partial [Eubacteriales bacterium]
MKIKTKNTVLALYTVAAIASGIALAVWRTVLIKRYYDPYHGSFEQGSGNIFKTYEYAVIAVCLVFLSALIFTRRISFRKPSACVSTGSVDR